MSQSPRNKAPRPAKNPGASTTGFALRLDVLPGLPLADCRQIERWLEDHAEAQGLVLSGHQLQQFVTAREHELSVNDQVALIDRLTDVPGVVGLRVGPIVERALAEVGDLALPDDDACVVVRSGDLALIGLSLLYRCGRISAPIYLQILGGYVRPAGLH